MRTSPVNKNKVLQTSAMAPVWAVGGSSFGCTWGGSSPLLLYAHQLCVWASTRPSLNLVFLFCEVGLC